MSSFFPSGLVTLPVSTTLYVPSVTCLVFSISKICEVPEVLQLVTLLHDLPDCLYNVMVIEILPPELFALT